jgi:hypothetical protein
LKADSQVKLPQPQTIDNGDQRQVITYEYDEDERKYIRITKTYHKEIRKSHMTKAALLRRVSVGPDLNMKYFSYFGVTRSSFIVASLSVRWDPRHI